MSSVMESTETKELAGMKLVKISANLWASSTFLEIKSK